jgi:integrase
VWRPGPPPARERTLTDSEIAIFWRGCNEIGWPFGPLFQLMLLTGCRLREAAGMTHGEIDADGVWTIPGNRTKNGRLLSLMLPPLARQIIDGVPVIESEAGYIFTTTGKTPVSGFSRAKHQLDSAMAKIAGHPVPGFRLHDLRRSAASGLAALGIALPVIEKILNHVSGSFGGVQGIYQRYEFSDEMAEALQRWGEHVRGLAAPQPDKVVPLHKAGA